MVKKLSRLSAAAYIFGGMFMGVMFEHMGPNMEPWVFAGIVGVGFMAIGAAIDTGAE